MPTMPGIPFCLMGPSVGYRHIPVMAAIPTKCVCVRARRATRSLTGLYDQALKPAGVKITQFSALRNIDRLQPVSISRLAQEMALDRSTLGRNLLLLRRKGLVSFSDA